MATRLIICGVIPDFFSQQFLIYLVIAFTHYWHKCRIWFKVFTVNLPIKKSSLAIFAMRNSFKIIMWNCGTWRLFVSYCHSYLRGQEVGVSAYGQGMGNIWLDDVQCNGNEIRLQDCQHRAWGIHNCVHSEDVGIKCDDAHSGK